MPSTRDSQWNKKRRSGNISIQLVLLTNNFVVPIECLLLEILGGIQKKSGDFSIQLVLRIDNFAVELIAPCCSHEIWRHKLSVLFIPPYRILIPLRIHGRSQHRLPQMSPMITGWFAKKDLYGMVACRSISRLRIVVILDERESHTATYCIHCSTLQHTAIHYNTLQHAATHCNIPQHTATHCNTRNTLVSYRSILRLLILVTPGEREGHTATYCNTLQYTAPHCNTLVSCKSILGLLILVTPSKRESHTATYCNTLQHTAPHCNTLQRTATHYNVLGLILRNACNWYASCK